MADDEINPEEEMIWPRGGRDWSSGGRFHVARSRRRDIGGKISATQSRWRDLSGMILATWSRQCNLTGKSRVGARSRRRVWLCEVESSLLSLLSLSLSFSLSLSLSLFARLSPEIVCSENRNVKQFPSHNLYFTVKWNAFPENFIFHAQPNTRWCVKWFPEMVWSQNKCTLIISSG